MPTFKRLIPLGVRRFFYALNLKESITNCSSLLVPEDRTIYNFISDTNRSFIVETFSEGTLSKGW